MKKPKRAPTLEQLYAADLLWLRAAIGSTEFDSQEAVIAQWLTEPDQPNRRELRARFKHRLKGVSASTLSRVALLVRSTCQALKDNDVEQLEQLAQAHDKLADVASERGRIAHALATCERVIAEQRAHLPVRFDQVAFELVQAYPDLAHKGISSTLRMHVTAIAKIKPSATGKPGRGHKGAPELLALLMTAAGVCSKPRAAARIKRANQARSKK